MAPPNNEHRPARRMDYSAWCRAQATAIETNQPFDREGLVAELRSLALNERNALFESTTATIAYTLGRQELSDLAETKGAFQEEAAQLAVESRERLKESPSLLAETERHWPELYHHGCLRAALLLDLAAIEDVDPEEVSALEDMLDIIASSQQLHWLTEGTPDAEYQETLREAYRRALQALSDSDLLPEDYSTGNEIRDFERLLHEGSLAGVSTARFPTAPPWSLDQLLGQFASP